MSSFFKNKKRKQKRKNESQAKSNNQSAESSELIDHSLLVNLDIIKKKTGNSSDIVIRHISKGTDGKLQIAIVYLDGLVNNQSIDEFLIQSMMNNSSMQGELTPKKALDTMCDNVIALGEVVIVHNWNELFLMLMSGDTIILIGGISQAISVGTKGGERRSIGEPTTQMVVRGSREGFTESIATNISLVRRIIKSPELWLESMKIGQMTKTDVSIMYMKGIANDKVVQEVRDRLEKINLDGILESGYIEQLIEDQTMTTFPTVYHTERPDVVAGNLLEGRIAIFVDGTPFVLIAPAVFIQFFQSAEDYYARFDIATSIRSLRIAIFFISLVAPAAYIAITTFHQEMIPTKLLIAIAAQLEVVPFPAFVEALIMEVTFEILREAGIRLPKAIGSAVSIVGALVIGQAAVQAGIVSPAMVIVVAMTAIASFATPSFSIAISARLVRFLFMISAATFGFFGIILALLVMTVHLCSLRSFGVPYMAPLAPFIPADAGDTVIRLPWWSLRKRPRLIAEKNILREGNHQGPRAPKSRGMVNSELEKSDKNE
ncbi:spore germination protein [Priestia megaterium]|nr:spore germination protein [Priestia megaterium]